MEIKIKLKILLFFFISLNSFVFSAGGFNFQHPSSFLRMKDGAVMLIDDTISVARGTLKVENGGLFVGANTSSKLSFSEGAFAYGKLHDVGAATVLFTGDYVLQTNKFLASGNTFVSSSLGLLTIDIRVSGTNNMLQGAPQLTNPITLFDSLTTLSVGIQTALKKNIILNSGTIYLSDTLHIGTDVIIAGSGQVVSNGELIEMGRYDTDWTSTLLFTGTTDIHLNAPIKLSGKWTFDGSASIRGSGTILDLSLGGTIFVKSNTRLSLSNIGIEALGRGFLIFEDKTSELFLQNTSIALSSDYTFTTGGIYIDGNALLVTFDHIMSFEQNSSLTVDNGTFWYDTLSFTDSINVRPIVQDNINLTLIRDGIIRAINNEDSILTSSLPVLFSLNTSNSSAIVHHDTILTSSLPALFALTTANSYAIVHHDTILTSTLPALFALTTANSYAIVHHDTILTSSLPALFALTTANSHAIVHHDNVLTSSLPVIFTTLGTIDQDLTDIVFTSATVTMSFDSYLSTDHTMRFVNSCLLDGNGHFINFAIKGSPLLFLDPSVSVTLSSVRLIGDFESQVSYGLASNLLFGNGSLLDFNDSHDLLTTLSFGGSATINGNGKVLTMKSGGNIITTPGSTLTLRNMTIRGVSGNNIRCLDGTAKIIFENVKLELDSNFSFTVGAFDVNEYLSLTGTSKFIYSSDQVSTILTRSKLYVDQRMTFSYDPPIANKSLLVLSDKTSELHFSSATLATNAVGMQLTKGQLRIQNLVIMRNEASDFSGAIVFGNGSASDNLFIFIETGSGISFRSGFLDYQNTE